MAKYICMLLICLLAVSAPGQDVYAVRKGTVSFSSSARHELISAESKELAGALDTRKKTFAFKVPIASFMGFNSPLQREHFNENYMETEKYAYASFTGKIIEDINLGNDGEYKVRAKGRLFIHGIDQERIIPVIINSKDNTLVFHAAFVVSLIDHSIKIPRVVYDKLAPDIQVRVAGALQTVK